MRNDFKSRVGQTIILLEGTRETEVPLVRVGAKYGYTELYGWQDSFELHTGARRTGRLGRYFPDRAALDAHLRGQRLRREVSDLTRNTFWTDRLAVEELEQVLAVIAPAMERRYP